MAWANANRRRVLRSRRSQLLYRKRSHAGAKKTGDWRVNGLLSSAEAKYACVQRLFFLSSLTACLTIAVSAVIV